MKINIKHVAKLANIPLTENEEEKLSSQLEETLQYIEDLQKINTQHTSTTNQVTNLENVTREDEARPSLSQEEALSNTKSQHNGFFKVKGILEE